jgi:hypothetical protein
MEGESEFPPPDDQSMDFMTDEALLEGGGAGAEPAEKVAETPAKKKVLVRVSGEPIVVSGKKKGGRPPGSKNKPKPVPANSPSGPAV